MRYSTGSLLKAAQRAGYAVPAFNVFDEVSLRAVLSAAGRAHSPVIVQLSTRTAQSIGVPWATRLFERCRDEVAVPAALHLDHCPDRAVIAQVVEAGWSSLLFDASQLDFDQAMGQTVEVVELAHRGGVEVESEIENIVGVEDGVGSDRIVHAYSAETLVEAARGAGVDFLAPQLGTAHGLYQGRPQLRPERVARFRELSDLPVVLHGGTGLTDHEFRSFIAAGVAKINVSTAIKRSYMKSSLAFLKTAEKTDVWEPGGLFRAAQRAVAEAVAPFFEVFGSAGRA
ncbi:MAG: class II fructose-bisphosphate aldolase [Propionibacteriaceae bacterium]|jgi:fructose-bisphosphate aldolase class II|nr:class II fructose-bisphosphate aldolase [Propionibacteriaceae bacterium]